MKQVTKIKVEFYSDIGEWFAIAKNPNTKENVSEFVGSGKTPAQAVGNLQNHLVLKGLYTAEPSG